MTSDTPTLFDLLCRDTGSLWSDFVEHPFVAKLADGTLPSAAFRRYLVQDYLFLIQFVRANALAAYKSTSLADIESAAAGIAALLAEMKMHVSFCAQWGLSEAQMAAEPEALETIAYTRHVFERGTAGDLLDLLVALAPCIQGYADIGRALASSANGSNPYAEWIRTYAGREYQIAARDAKQALDKVGERLGASSRMVDLQTSFDTAVRLETAFWDMGLRATERDRPL